MKRPTEAQARLLALVEAEQPLFVCAAGMSGNPVHRGKPRPAYQRARNMSARTGKPHIWRRDGEWLITNERGESYHVKDWRR